MSALAVRFNRIVAKEQGGRLASHAESPVPPSGIPDGQVNGADGVEVHAGDGVGVIARQPKGDAGADVAALRTEARVVEPPDNPLHSSAI